jgi:hypothetical protein
VEEAEKVTKWSKDSKTVRNVFEGLQNGFESLLEAFESFVSLQKVYNSNNQGNCEVTNLGEIKFLNSNHSHHEVSIVSPKLRLKAFSCNKRNLCTTVDIHISAFSKASAMRKRESVGPFAALAQKVIGMIPSESEVKRST